MHSVAASFRANTSMQATSQYRSMHLTVHLEAVSLQLQAFVDFD